MTDTVPLEKTVLNAWHHDHGGKMVPFAGWEMPVRYARGDAAEHLAVRRSAGIFDVSHMGRISVTGRDAGKFLDFVTTNSISTLREGQAAYTVIANERGGAIDDSYAYRIGPEEFMFVVNASNRLKDWKHLALHSRNFNVELTDRTRELAMYAVQGPESERIISELMTAGRLPESRWNRLSNISIQGMPVTISRTGYTGGAGFELFVDSNDAQRVWQTVVDRKVEPIGLATRNTLRTEGQLPLYGHEYGLDPFGREIEIWAVQHGRLGTSFSKPSEFIGREALQRQMEEIRNHVSGIDHPLVPRMVTPIAVLNKDRTGPSSMPIREFDSNRKEIYRIYLGDKDIGFVTSGGPIPTSNYGGLGVHRHPVDGHFMRSVGLALVDTEYARNARDLEVRVVRVTHPGSDNEQFGREVPALLGVTNLRKAGHHAFPTVQPETPIVAPAAGWSMMETAQHAVKYADTRRSGLNVIASENMQRPVEKAAQGVEALRYFECVESTALGVRVPFYRGTEFNLGVLAEVETKFRTMLGATAVEVRPYSGNIAVQFVMQGVFDYFNRFNRGEKRRIGLVMNNALHRGGHLSAQHFGTLQDLVTHESPVTGGIGVIPFPVHPDNQVKIDVEAAKADIERYRPEVILFGKSVMLEAEPIKELVDFTRTIPGYRPVVIADYSHVMGLIGHLPNPLDEGADILVGSTHKTLWGSQRGIFATKARPGSEEYRIFEYAKDRAFPKGSSNFHPGTLLAQLVALQRWEMHGERYMQDILNGREEMAQGILDAHGKIYASSDTHQLLVVTLNGQLAADNLEKNAGFSSPQSVDNVDFVAARYLRVSPHELVNVLDPSQCRPVGSLIIEGMRGVDVRDSIGKLMAGAQDRFRVPNEDLLKKLYMTAAGL